MPNTTHLKPTMAPVLSKLACREAPFYRKSQQGCVVQAWLALDISLRHIDVVFTSKSASREQTPVLDHDGGMLYLPLPSELTGFLADEILLSDRVQRMLGYLLMTSYHSEETGILVEEPMQFEATAMKIVDMLLDHAGFEEVLVVDALTLQELNLKGVDANGHNRRTPENIHHVHDKLLGIDIVTEEDMDKALAVRIQKASARGVHLQGLRKRMKLLLEMARGGDKSAVLPTTSQAIAGASPSQVNIGMGEAQMGTDGAASIRQPDAEITTLAEPAVESSRRGAGQKESPHTLDMFGPDEAVASGELVDTSCAQVTGPGARRRRGWRQVASQRLESATRYSHTRPVTRRFHKPVRAAPVKGRGPIAPDILCQGPGVPRTLMDFFEQ